jgi:mono/diheme cytochrome c family protein
MIRTLIVRISALVLIGALAACAKGESSSSASASPSESAAAMSTSVSVSAAPSAAVAENGVAAADGAKVFETNCSSCHQTNGQGVAGTFPPLAGNPVVTGDATTPIHIVKYGLNGKIMAEGGNYNGMMPAWGQQLSNADIAAVLTYVRSAWGNKASAVTEADVAAVAQ